MTEETAPKVEILAPEPSFMGAITEGLSAQQRRFVLLRCSGMTLSASAVGAGYNATYGGHLMQQPEIKLAIDRFHESTRDEVGFGVPQAHAMLMEAWANAANSTEQRLVVDSLMKLHKLGEQKTDRRSVTININKLDQMSDEKLLQLAGKAGNYLDPDE